MSWISWELGKLEAASWDRPALYYKVLASWASCYISWEAGQLDTVYKLHHELGRSCVVALRLHEKIFRRINVQKLLPENYPHRFLARDKLRYSARNQEHRELAQAVSPSSWKIENPLRKIQKIF